MIVLHGSFVTIAFKKLSTKVEHSIGIRPTNVKFFLVYLLQWMIVLHGASTGPFLWQSNFLPFPAFTQIYRGDVHKYLLKNLFYMGSKTLEAKFVIFFLPLFIQVTNLTLNDFIVKITNEEEMSHKGKKFRSYPLKIKTRSCQVC